MIVDSIKNIERYENIHPNISTALHFIAEHEEDPELEDGRYELIPDEVIVYVLSKESHYREEAEMEIVRQSDVESLRFQKNLRLITVMKQIMDFGNVKILIMFELEKVNSMPYGQWNHIVRFVMQENKKKQYGK